MSIFYPCFKESQFNSVNKGNLPTYLPTYLLSFFNFWIDLELVLHLPVTNFSDADILNTGFSILTPGLVLYTKRLFKNSKTITHTDVRTKDYCQLWEEK